MNTTQHGVDISEWNGNVDFKKLKSVGVDFVIMREGFRNRADSRFVSYVKQAKEANLPILGVYHFIYIDGATPTQNAQSTITTLQTAGLDPTDILIFADLEYDTWTKAKEKVTKAKCTAYVKEYLQALENAGCHNLGIYLNIDYYLNNYDWSQLQGYPLWLADYTNGPDYDCMIQQTTDKGTFPGITGQFDLDTLFVKEQTGGDTVSTRPTAKQTLDAFSYWLGYYEKASSSYANTRDKSAFEKNKGANNYTYAGYICGINGPGASWCAMQVNLAIYEACGNNKALAKETMWGVWPYKTCDQLYDAAPANKKGKRGAWNPKPGDVIVFSDNGRTRTHTGMVYKVDGSTVYTYEGNKGNMCKTCSYPKNSSYIWGYVRPNYTEGAKWVAQGNEWKFQLANGQFVTDTWVAGSTGKWYYIAPNGLMCHNGLTFVHKCAGINEDGSDAGTFAEGWFYFQEHNDDGCIGAALSGVVDITASTTPEVPAVNVGVFEDTHNGHWGAMKSLNGRPLPNYDTLP